MKLLLLCLLFAGTVLLSACGPNLQQQVDALQRSNTALNKENQALHVQVKSLQGQIAVYNQAEALARAKAQGMEQARIQAGERLAALAPACDIIPFACSESFKREANAALAQFPPDPNLAIAWSLGTAAVLLGLEVASLSVLFRLYSRSWRPELERARAARELLATADARHAELDRACDTLEALVAQERRRLQQLQEQATAARAGLEELDQAAAAARSDLTMLRAECEHMRGVRDALSGL